MNILCIGIKYLIICVLGPFAQYEEDCIVVKLTIVHCAPEVGKGDVNYQTDVGYCFGSMLSLSARLLSPCLGI